MKKGFTLIEMLIVIGIIAVLVGASLVSFSKMMKNADKTKARELLSETVTALTAIYEADGIWPKKLRDASSSGQGMLDQDVALIIAKRGFMSLSLNSDSSRLTGKDRFGIVTPWAASVIKSRGTAASLGTKVSGNDTVEDHIVYFAIDLDGDGLIEEAGENGDKVRATAATWCRDKDGKYIHSWTDGQTKSVE